LGGTGRFDRLRQLGLLAVAQVAIEIGLAQAIAGSATRRLLDDDVGHDALGLDRAPVGREVAGRRELDGGVAVERQDGLHRALAEALGAHHDGTLVVLQAPATISEADAEPPFTSTTIGTVLMEAGTLRM
jgi:hypothetical protein